MVQEQAGVEVRSQVHPELQPLLGNREPFARVAGRLVLLSPPDLGAMLLRVEVAPIHLEHLADRSTRRVALLPRRAPRQGRGPRILDQMNPPFVPIDRAWIFGQIPIVDSKGGQFLATRPFSNMPEVFPEAVAEGGRMLPAPLLSESCRRRRRATAQLFSPPPPLSGAPDAPTAPKRRPLPKRRPSPST